MTRRVLFLLAGGVGLVSAAAAQSVPVSGSTQLALPLSVVITAIVATFGAGGTWVALHKRVQRTEENFAEVKEWKGAIDRKLDEKAPNTEMERQRDNIGTLFEKIDEVKDTMNNQHAVVLSAIGEHRADIERVIRETYANRRGDLRARD